jgi:hypothetical protein
MIGQKVNEWGIDGRRDCQATSNSTGAFSFEEGQYSIQIFNITGEIYSFPFGVKEDT